MSCQFRYLYISQQILAHLKKHVGVDKSGKLDAPTMALLMTLLYSIDIEGQTEDGLASQSLMLEQSFVKNFHQVCVKPPSQYYYC